MVKLIMPKHNCFHFVRSAKKAGQQLLSLLSDDKKHKKQKQLFAESQRVCGRLFE